jgi:hypothetical protein
MYAVEHEFGIPAGYAPERRQSPRVAGPARVHLELAAWLLAHEMSDAGGGLAIGDAAERVCQKLLDRMSRLITPSGCRALLSRALHLVGADFAFLRGIEPGSLAQPYLEGIGRSAQSTDAGQVQRGIAALLGTLIELVALFIGEYLTGRLLREVWPDLPVPEPSRPPRTVQ